MESRGLPGFTDVETKKNWSVREEHHLTLFKSCVYFTNSDGYNVGPPR